MDESHVEDPVRPGLKNWKELFTTCPHIAERIFKYLKVEDALKCREVYPKWEPVIVNCKQLTARAKKIPLWRAAENGHLKTVEFLIGQGADVNSARQERTALMRAANEGHYDIARLLINCGADVDAKDSFWETALCKATQKGQFDIARLLIETVKSDMARLLVKSGADANNCLEAAVQEKNFHRAVFLVEAGADINRRCLTHGGTLLINAMEFGLFDIARLLIEIGADTNASDNFGSTPLMIAARQNRLQMAEFLVRNGADVNAINIFGESALIVAWLRGNTKLGKFLLDNGAIESQYS